MLSEVAFAPTALNDACGAKIIRKALESLLYMQKYLLHFDVNLKKHNSIQSCFRSHEQARNHATSSLTTRLFITYGGRS